VTFGAKDPVVILEADTPYHHITLREKDRSRFMDFDRIRQSGIALDYPLELRLRYPRVQAVALAFHPEPRQVLAIGLGAGSFPKRLHHDWPEATIDVVEIDPQVIALAQQYFDLQPDAHLRIHAGDGRRFLQEGSTRYDLVLVDAYNGDNIPFHLTTREFYRELRARMDDDALLVSNVVGRLGPGRRYLRAMLRTVADTFPVVQMIPTSAVDPNVDMNFIVVARRRGARLSAAELQAAVARLDGKMVPREELEKYAAQLLEPLPSLDDAPLLTDDYAPVELLRAE
jgi:spermidine synthase